MRPPRGGARRLAVVVTAALAATGAGVSTAHTALAGPGADPSVVGAWSEPFEEGGADTPRCELVPSDTSGDPRERLQCKPTAVTAAMLPDGRLLYGNGLEDFENAEEGALLSVSPESRNSRTRVLDMRDGTPEWSTPEQNETDGTNPRIVEGRTSDDCLSEAPLGVAGVPGRPGDGFVGSLAGQAGLPAAEPTCSPDDAADNDGDLFCGDIVQLADGRAMLVGGTDWYNEPSVLERADGDPANVGLVELEGLQSARIFDPERDRWDATTPMKFGRWYPAATTLPDGQVAVHGGVAKLIKSSQLSQVLRTEVYDPATATWEEQYTSTASEKSMPLIPRTFLAPNGKLFYTGDGQTFGPMGQAIDQATWGQQAFFDLDTDQWETANTTIPRGSPAVVSLPMQAPYDEMTILRAGGTLGPTPGSYLASDTTRLVTLTADDRAEEVAGPALNHARSFSQAVALPTGEVLLNGGGRQDHVLAPGMELPVRQPELYDPEANTFTALAPSARDRTYHHSAVLLPNGQVLTGGHSPIAALYGPQRDVAPGVTANNDNDPSFELYNPPYLFRGDRPHIDSVRSGIAWGEEFDIATEDAGEVSSVMLMRMPSPQHVMDNDTRSLRLPFTADGGNLRAVAPPDGVAAPPGYYYLFVNRDGEGGEVPSVARIVHIGGKSDLGEAIEPMGPETVEGFAADGATPTEDNTILNNPPNPNEAPTVPGEPDPLAPPLPGAGGDGAEAPAGPELPTGPGLPGATLPSAPLGGAQGRRAGRSRRRG